jgi:outer membrane protein OmpA-like peptidoglycan-associated protein
MSRYGKCQNFSGCLLAYRGEETEVESDQPFICAECGKPLTEVGSPSAMWLRYAYAMAGVIVVGGIIIFSVPAIRGKIFKPKKPEPGEMRTSTENSESATSESSPANTASEPVAEPPRVVTAPAHIDLDLNRQENKAVKSEVLTRVDLMPVSTTNKDKLYSAVEKARSMGKILTIPFGSGKTELAATDLEALKTELAKPQIAKLRDDPTAVFVILGYADPKGDAKKNLAISQTRAEAVMKAMKDKLGVINLMHTVGMGGSKLLDSENLEKNRIVEIWAVLP